MLFKQHPAIHLVIQIINRTGHRLTGREPKQDFQIFGVKVSPHLQDLKCNLENYHSQQYSMGFGLISELYG